MNDTVTKMSPILGTCGSSTIVIRAVGCSFLPLSFSFETREVGVYAPHNPPMRK